MKKKIYIASGIILIVIIAIIVYSTSGKENIAQLETSAKNGKFEILVTITGELQAENSEKIMAPAELRSRQVRFGQLKIQDLIPEGTVVDSGDFVAKLDRADADNTLKDIDDELERRETAFVKTKIDTTIRLRNLRDELINLKFGMEEAEITLEQSKYEPPTTIRQAQINLDKTTRAHEQAKKNYKLKVQQANADMKEVAINLAKQQRRKEVMEKVLEKFTIYAPKPGMVIYMKEWGGAKRKVGSNISPWDLTVATLPDLSSMISKTYVNEIDISKLKVGQQVRIGVDAFPEKKYIGEVIEVANIGEQLPNTDAKVFEVVIKVFGSDPILRPSMTTSNAIIIVTFDSVTYVPLEAIHSNDSVTFVYKKNGVKQIVVLGESNENEIIVEQGLEAGEIAFLSVPENAEDFEYEGLELIEVIKQREEEKIRLEEESKRKAEEEANKKKEFRFDMRQLPPGMTIEQMEEMMKSRESGGQVEVQKIENK